VGDHFGAQFGIFGHFAGKIPVYGCAENRDPALEMLERERIFLVQFLVNKERITEIDLPAKEYLFPEIDYHRHMRREIEAVEMMPDLAVRNRYLVKLFEEQFDVFPGFDVLGVWDLFYQKRYPRNTLKTRKR
jgi:hypothetical protein